MKNPTEEQLKIIYKIARQISSNKWIPGYEKEDIEQEAIIIGIKGTHRYNGSIPFDKFIGNHMRNRLMTLRRDKYIKPGCSCGKCKKCINNSSISSIMNASDIENEKSIPINSETDIESKDLLEYLDNFIPADLREDYLKLLQGVSIQQNRKEKLREIIRDALDA